MEHRPLNLILFVMLLSALGCGSTKQHTVTEQLLSSDAVDRAVAQIDFRVISGRKVYVDTSYIQPVKNVGFVNDRYIVSSLRQQMAAAGCLLQDSAKDADVVVEPRVGALGTDLHEVVYGIPANNLLSNVASLAPGAPQIPAIPELSVAKKNQHLGAAKVSVFAYERETRDPIWQSGVAQAESRARDTWVMGAGPFQSGTIYNRTQFAGSEINLPLVYDNADSDAESDLNFERPYVYLERPTGLQSKEGKVRLAGGQRDDDEPAKIRPLSHEEPEPQQPKKEAPDKKSPAKEKSADKSAPKKDLAAKAEPNQSASEQESAAPQANESATNLPTDLMQHLEQFSQPLGQPVNPWYLPSPQVSSAE